MASLLKVRYFFKIQISCSNMYSLKCTLNYKVFPCHLELGDDEWRSFIRDAEHSTILTRARIVNKKNWLNCFLMLETVKEKITFLSIILGRGASCKAAFSLLKSLPPHNDDFRMII